ncbi:hypothetical protein GCM10010989_09250 [Croceicoccus pelagius]|uniref:Uncharacterized protein n=1 Tax=Croceicoccus pelagius TaxID=1703341 RepID=A0A916YA55_9SPHN|nr:hypothetical protein GCM10010989_09250 [Croceicoccus pelagius]
MYGKASFAEDHHLVMVQGRQRFLPGNAGCNVAARGREFLGLDISAIDPDEQPGVGKVQLAPQVMQNRMP